MGYSYIEGNEYLGHGPNISGMGFLIRAFDRAGGKAVYPNMGELLETGESDNPLGVKGEAERMAKEVKAPNVKEAFGRLAGAAALAKKVISLSH